MPFALMWIGVIGVFGGLHRWLARNENASTWEVVVAHTLFWVAVSVFIVRAFLIAPFVTAGPSMSPTLPSGSLVWVEENAYGFTWPWLGLSSVHTAPPKGDVVAFRAPDDRIWIKRVRARPGDTLRFVKGDGWYVNGVKIAAPSTFSMRTWDGWPGRNGKSYVIVPPHKVFLVGDNTLDSTDSRDFGLIPVASLIGRVAWPKMPLPPAPPGLR